MKKRPILQALFAAAAFALALPSCSDLSTKEDTAVVATKEGKIAVQLSVTQNYRTIISALPDDITYTLNISGTADDEAERYQKTLTLESISTTPVVYLDEGAYTFELIGKSGETPIISGNTTQTISATNTSVSISLAAVTGEAVDVSLALTIKDAQAYGLSAIAVTLYTDEACTAASTDTDDSLAAALVEENSTLAVQEDGTYTVSGSVVSGAHKWVKIELKDADGTVIGSKVEELYAISSLAIEDAITVAIKQYKATIALTAEQAKAITLKNTAVTADDYTGITWGATTDDAHTVTTDSTTHTYTGYIPVGSYGIYVDSNSLGTVANTAPVTVNAGKYITGIEAAWANAEKQFYTSSTANDLLENIKITVKYSDNTSDEPIFAKTAENAAVASFAENGAPDFTKTSEQELTIVYNKQTATIKVTLNAVQIQSIAVDAEASAKTTNTDNTERTALKTEYTINTDTAIDLTGLVLTVTKNDGTIESVEFAANNITATKYFKDTDGSLGDEVSNFTTVMATTGTYWVQVTYEEKTANYKISVKPAGVTLYKFGTALSDEAKTAKSYTFSTDNDVLIFDTPLNLNKDTKASIKATFTAESAKVGVGFVSFADGKAYSNSTISYRVFGTNQSVRYFTSDATKWNGSGYSSAVQTSPYTVTADINVTAVEKMTFSISGIVSDKGTTSSKADSLTKWITDATKPVYLAIGTETGTASLDLSSIEITIYENGTPQTYNVGSLADLPEDTRASLSPSTTELSYTIASSVSGNKGDATTITLTDDLLSAVKAKNGDTEVAGTWKWAANSVSLAAGKSSVTAKANFTPEDTSAYKSITAQEFTITVTDEREEKPEDEVVSVIWNFASPSTLAAYGTATADESANKVTYADGKNYAGNTVSDTTYFTATSASISLMVAGTIRDNTNSAQIGSDSYIYVPVSAGSVMTVTGYNGYTNYTVTLNGDKTDTITSAEAKSFTAKTAGFAKIEGGSKDEQNSKTDNYIVSISVTNITRADIIKLYGKEAENIATFPTPDEPTVTITGDNTVTIATDETSATLDLTAAITNAGNATVSWTSSDEAIATVAAKGDVTDNTATVTAKTAGTVTITASITVNGENYTGSFTITVDKGASVNYVAKGTYSLSGASKATETKPWTSQNAGTSQTLYNITTTTKIDSSGFTLRLATDKGYATFSLKESTKVSITFLVKVNNKKDVDGGFLFSTTDGSFASEDEKVTIGTVSASGTIGADDKNTKFAKQIVSVAKSGSNTTTTTVLTLGAGTYKLYGSSTSTGALASELKFE